MKAFGSKGSSHVTEVFKLKYCKKCVRVTITLKINYYVKQL